MQSTVSPTTTSPMSGDLPWLHGIEGVTKGGDGLVFWNGRHVGFFGFSDGQEIQEQRAATELQTICLTIERAGRQVKSEEDLVWSNVLSVVDVVDMRTLKSLDATSMYYMKEGTLSGESQMSHIASAIKAARVLGKRGLVACFDVASGMDPSAVVMFRIPDSKNGGDGQRKAINQLRRRFLYKYTEGFPSGVASLVRAKADVSIATPRAIGVRFFSDAFEDPASYSLLGTVHVLRKFSSVYPCDWEAATPERVAPALA